MVYTVERFVSRLDQLTPHKLDARKAVSSARSRAARYMCATFILRKYGVTQDAHRPPCARHPAQTAQSNALVTAYRESRDRGVRMSVRVHTHMCLSIGHVSLTILREIIASGHAQNLSHEIIRRRNGRASPSVSR